MCTICALRFTDVCKQTPAPVNLLVPLTPDSTLNTVFTRLHTTYCCCGSFYCLELLSLGTCTSRDEEHGGIWSSDTRLETPGDRCLTSPWMKEEMIDKREKLGEPVRAHTVRHPKPFCTGTQCGFNLFPVSTQNNITK